MRQRTTMELLVTERQKCEEGHVYYCGVCNELIAVTKQFIHPRKIFLVYENCPGCGFELETVLRGDLAEVPAKMFPYVNPAASWAEYLVDKPTKFSIKVTRGSLLPRDLEPSLPTGIGVFDEALSLRFGHFAALRGSASNSLSLLFCVKSVLPVPKGPGRHAVFVDGGNLFDTYAIADYLIEHGQDPNEVEKRVHLSRSFTFHQLSSTVTERLSEKVDELEARLVVVSDITALFCDPDVRDQQEARAVFTSTVGFLRDFAEQNRVLVIATALHERDRWFDEKLFRTAHVAAEFYETEFHTQVRRVKHPFLPPASASFSKDGQSLLTDSIEPIISHEWFPVKSRLNC